MSEDAQDIRTITDRIALRDLSLRYARGVDRRDLTLFASVFHDDAEVDFGEVYAGSASAFVEKQPELLVRYELTAHYNINGLYVIDGDVAQGEVYFLAYHRARSPGEEVTTVGGRYLDVYERRDDRWKIRRRSVVWDHLSATTISAAERNALALLGSLGGHGDDPSYQVLSF